MPLSPPVVLKRKTREVVLFLLEGSLLAPCAPCLALEVTRSYPSQRCGPHGPLPPPRLHRPLSLHGQASLVYISILLEMFKGNKPFAN